MGTGALVVRFVSLALLAFSAICYQSIHHLLLFTASLILNAAFAFRRKFPSSAWILNLSIIYIFVHFILLFFIQIPFFRDTIDNDIRSAFGLVDVICLGKAEDQCDRPHWPFYIGCLCELGLMFILAWNRGLPVARFEYTTEADQSWRQQVYLVCPITILLWALLFPSWLSFVWLIASWFLFSRIGERRHRLTIAPVLISYASFLLLVHYICCLVDLKGTAVKKIGLHSMTGSAAFYSLFFKVVFTIPFYLMRYIDGGSLDVPENSVARQEAVPIEYTRLQWISPFICLFTCILYICLRFLFLLQYGDWSTLTPDQWLGSGTGILIRTLWLPILFIIFIVFVHLRRLEHPYDAAWHPTSTISKIFATYCDTVISVLLSIFASLNISAIGLVLLLLSVIIFVATPKIRNIACCAACVLLAILWMLSFLTSAMGLPSYEYPEHCVNVFRFDQNSLQWLGISSEQLWTIIVLLFLMSTRCAFYVDKSEWLKDVERSDAEKMFEIEQVLPLVINLSSAVLHLCALTKLQDIPSAVKFLAKYWMHKFGVEVSLIFGLIVACCHHDILGLLFFVSVSIFRLFSRRRCALFWPYYAQFLLFVVIIEYISALGIPRQFYYCIHFFWQNWETNLRRYLVLPSSVGSSAIIILDFIFVLFVLAQKEIFEREDDNLGGDNKPLSEIFAADPSAQSAIPSLYKDFIASKGTSMAYVHSAIFLYAHWMTLIVILICSIEGGSFLAFGYIITVFVLLWMDTHLYSNYPHDRFLLYWNILVYYNLVALGIKLIYLNSTCFLFGGLPCWIESFLGLRCAVSPCKVYSTTVLIYDVLCFVTLIFQLRIFNSWYFRLVIMDYRADRILGSRGAELLLEMKAREGRKSERRLHSNVNWIELVVAAEERVKPDSCGPPPMTHEEIKRSGYYHQMYERFFPRWAGNPDADPPRRLSSITPEIIMPPARDTREQESTMVEKTVEVLDSVRVTAHHLFQLINNPEWLFQISKGHAFVAHVLEMDKRKIKAIYKERLLTADSTAKIEALKEEFSHREEFITKPSSQTLTNEALEEWHSIRPAFKFVYCLSHAVMAQSELVCFILMLFVHLSKSSFISLPLPIMVFCWGALSVPSPPKSFWFFATCYVQFVILFRMLFQNEMIYKFLSEGEAEDDENPFSAARLLGVHPSVDGTYWDITLLAMLFLHRYKLMRLGMYGDDYREREHQADLLDSSRERDNGPLTLHCWEKLACNSFLRPLLMAKTPSSMDWYPWMVACDAFCLILISMFYSMIGQGGSGNVLSDVQASRVPRWFAYTLPIVFFIMIFDRWLYMSKRITFRLLFYSSLVVLLHAAIFYFVPSITGRSVTWNGAAIALYLTKSAYLLMNAWHLRNGFPSVLNRDILTRNYGIARLLILKIYLNIPFLFELRTVMDWTFTSTALAMGDFLRLENYYNEFLAQNCWIQFDHWIDNYFPTRKGRPTPTSGKFFKGVASIIALITIILAPILLFAFLNSFGTRAPPKHLRLTVAVGGFPALYEMQATHEGLFNITAEQMNAFDNELLKRKDDDLRRSAFSFLSVFSNADVFEVHLEPDSLFEWQISNPARDRLLKTLRAKERASLIFNIYVERESGDTQRSHRYTHTAEILRKEAAALSDMISGVIVESNLTLGLPRYFLVPPSGDLTPANPVNLVLETTKMNSTWRYYHDAWSIQFNEPPILFVDRIVPSWMSIIVGSGGMMAMYVAVILVVGRFVREIVRTPLANTMIEVLPNADNILRLIQDIYVVREKRQFYLESRLYGKLCFLVRSPETMIRWSRYRVKEKLD